MKMPTIGKWGVLVRLSHYRRFLRDGKVDQYRDGDAEENERGRLPDNEGIQTPALWLAELYTPSHIEGLVSGIQKLGWERGRSRNDSLIEWTADVRQGKSAGWTSLGLVSDARTPHFMSERTADLPSGVDAAFPFLISLTPSITALVVGFTFSDSESDCLNLPLRATYATYTSTDPFLRTRDILSYIVFGKRAKFSRAIHHPDSQRRNALSQTVDDLESKCARWIRKNLPGVFSSGTGGGNLPSAILLVTEQMAPATDELHGIRALDGLSFGAWREGWMSSEWPGVRLDVPRSSMDSQSRLVFACRRRDAFPDRPGYQDPTSNWTIAQRAEDMVRGILTRWALGRVLNGYHEELSTLRDKSAGDRAYHAARDLKQLRSLVRHRLFDIAVTAQEVEELAANDWSYRHDVLDLSQPGPQNSQFKLIEALCSSQRGQAQRLLRDANLLQSVLSLSSDISQTLTNLRLQRVIFFLTIASLFVGAWALEVAIKTAH